MVTIVKNLFVGVCAVLLGLTVVKAHAADVEKPAGAYDVVVNATSSMKAILAEAPSYVDDDPQRYYNALHTTLDPVIDYKGFARGVMGAYGSAKHYRALDSAGKKQLREQLARFTDVIKTNLVKTYGKGLLTFGGSRIETLPLSPEDADKRIVSVRQQVFGESGEPREVNYQMAKNKAGQWKLRNVIIEAVNLGKVYRNQFEAAARQYNGDLDAVIDNWQGQDATTK